MAYTLQINDGSQHTLHTLGVIDAQLTLNVNAWDTLDLTIDATLPAAATFTIGDRITLRDDSTIRYVGEVITDPRAATATTAPHHTYHTASYLARLDRISYTQSTKVYVAAAETTILDPTVILGQDASGNRCTNVQQIRDVITYAATERGVPIEWPDDVTTGYQCPLDQRDTITCWEAIITQLRWLPDHVLYCRYTANTTRVYIRNTANAGIATVSLSNAQITGTAITPRHDLLLDGVRCVFRWIDDYNGKTREVRSFQTAGNISSPFCRDLYVDLEGSSRTTIEQRIKVTTLPSLTNLNGDIRTWLTTRVPWLADLAPGDWTITDAVRTGVKNYDKELIEGSISSWMPIGSEFETINFTINYATKDSAGKYVDKATAKLPVALLSTNGSTRTYRKTTAYSAPEPAPTGLAEGIYTAWQHLHYDGTLDTALSAVGWSLWNGYRLNITGGLTAWATMGAYIQRKEINLATGAISLTFGTPRSLEPDSLIALTRALRGRRFSWKRYIGADAESPIAVSGGEQFPSDATSDSPAFARRFLRVSDQISDKTHDITIDPTSIIFTTPANSANQDIKLREVIIPSIDAQSGKPIAKLVQALCGAPYGSEIPLGGGAAENPGATITTIGAASEGADAASTNTWTAGTANGLSEWYVSRVVYNHTGDKKLYSFLRKRTYDSSGRLYSISAETRVEVDTPVVLS